MQVADGTETHPRQPNTYCTGMIDDLYSDAVLSWAELQAASWHKLEQHLLQMIANDVSPTANYRDASCCTAWAWLM